MSVLKRITAGLTALSLIAVCTGCKNTTTAMTIGDYVVPAGVYLYYLNSAYQNALSQLKEDDENLDTADLSAVKAASLEGKDIRTWCEDKAVEFCTDFVTTEKKFDELGLSLDADTKSGIDSMMDYYWASYETTMTEHGISQESFRKVMTSSYKSQEIFDYYYAVGGEEGVTEDELKEYYIANNIRAQYISFDLHDSEGNLLKSDGKAEIKALAEEYQKRAEDAYASGGADAVMTEMDKIKEDYAAYQESVAAEEAAAETDTEAVIEESAAAFDAPYILTAEEISSSEAETVQDTSEPETSPEEETTEEVPDENAETSAEDEITEEASDEDAGISAEDETTEEVSDDAPADEESVDSSVDEDAETEDESVPYQNENIISVINKEDYDNEEDIYYTPDETVYNKLLEITEADYGKVYLVEEDEIYYLVVRYDIAQRMTEDDLWTENAVSNAEYGKYYDEFEAKMDEWGSALAVSRNEASFKRYDPYEYNF